MSFHLKELQNAGLIDARREGRFLFYHPNFPRITQVLSLLNECCVLADKDCGTACGEAATENIKPKKARA